MELNIQAPEVVIRERRLKSILTYHGPASRLCSKSRNDGYECHDNTFNQCGDCSAQRAALPIAQIRDSAMVNHAPIGCAGDFANFNSQFRRGLRYRNLPIHNIQALCTNLTEKDMIYGGTEKLILTIKEAFARFGPKAIFITTSCASGIIGDDIEDTANSMEKELGIPIVPIYCEGFKSKIWTTGFDSSYHGILRKLVRPPKKKQPNVINIMGFTNELAFTPLLKKIGLTPKYLVHHTSVDELAHISEAAASAHICETLGTYMARGLEQEYGVPEVKSPPPYGIQWTDRWLRELGKITNREDLVEKVITKEKLRIEQELSSLKRELENLKVFVLAGASFGHNLLSIARDLGLKPVGITGFHHDQHFDNDNEEINSLNNVIELFGEIENYNICNKQPYQLTKLLHQAKPDLLLSRHDTIPSLGYKLGIPTFFTSDANLQIGYDGVIYTGRKIVQALRGRNLIKNIAKHVKMPYSQWWLEQDPFIFGEKYAAE